LSYLLIGLLGGIVSTVIMTLTEIPSWKRWGLPGVFEWHENQVITRRLFKLSNDNNNINFKGVFFFHFLNVPITGLSPFNHPLGHMPALASLGGHIVYGLVLGFMMIFAFISYSK
jgi:hypothetical protein